MDVRLWHYHGAETYSVRDDNRPDGKEGGLVAWVVWRTDSLGDRYLWCRMHNATACIDVQAVKAERRSIGMDREDQ